MEVGKVHWLQPGKWDFQLIHACAMFLIKHRSPSRKFLKSRFLFAEFRIQTIFSAPSMSDDHAHHRQASTSSRRWLIWKSRSTRLQQRRRSIYRDANIEPAFAWILSFCLALATVCSAMVSGGWRFSIPHDAPVLRCWGKLVNATMFSVIWWQILPFSNVPVPPTGTDGICADHNGRFTQSSCSSPAAPAFASFGTAFEVESVPALLRPELSVKVFREPDSQLLETTNNKTEEKKNNFNKTRRIAENGARTTRATTSTAQFIFFFVQKVFLCFTFSDGENTTVYLKTSCCAEGPLTLTEKKELWRWIFLNSNKRKAKSRRFT